MTKRILNEVSKHFELEETKNEQFAHLKVSGMKFNITSYNAKGLGSVGVMEASGFFGLMKMVTLIINPFEKDAPLLSYDRIFAFGNDTMILELYDTMLDNSFDTKGLKAIKDKNAGLPNYDNGSHWYDDILMSESVHLKTKTKNNKGFDELVDEYVKEYMEAVLKTKACDVNAKREKAKAYSDGLLNNGGPSTDIFVKKFGKEFTTGLFEKVLFGTNK